MWDIKCVICSTPSYIKNSNMKDNETNFVTIKEKKRIG